MRIVLVAGAALALGAVADPTQEDPVMGGTAQLVLSVVGGTVAAMIPVVLLFWRIIVYFDKKAEKARDGVEKRAEASVAAVVETLKSHRDVLDGLVAEMNRMKGGQEARDEIERRNAAQMRRPVPDSTFETH